MGRLRRKILRITMQMQMQMQMQRCFGGRQEPKLTTAAICVNGCRLMLHSPCIHPDIGSVLLSR